MKHIMHFLDLGGEKHISLGTDFDGCRAFAAVLKEDRIFPYL
jgi:microsomal dipeptidase-like Zn-dependent dipeptidase